MTTELFQEGHTTYNTQLNHGEIMAELTLRIKSKEKEH
jgi:hypothetical protein